MRALLSLLRIRGGPGGVASSVNGFTNVTSWRWCCQGALRLLFSGIGACLR